MGKHLVDIDEQKLQLAKLELGTETIKDTVNEALDRVSSDRLDRFRRALEYLAAREFEPRENAWRSFE